MIFPVGIPAYTVVSVLDEEAQWLHDQSIGMNIILEVGSYQGRSTYCLACDSKTPVHAVDIWDESNGYVNGYSTFIDNMRPYYNVVPHRMSSCSAAELFDNKTIDMVFIDGDHSYEEVSRDIKIWLPKTRRLICGHDYNSDHPGVTKAVDCCGLSPIFTKNCIWYHFIK